MATSNAAKDPKSGNTSPNSTPTIACKFKVLVSLSTGNIKGMARMVLKVAFPDVRDAIPLVKVKTTLNPMLPKLSPAAKTP